jgi:hypothetical protein
VSSSKKLKPGRYTLKIVAAAHGATSAPAAISFTIAGYAAATDRDPGRTFDLAALRPDLGGGGWLS